MAEYVVQDTSLVRVADEIRILSDTSDKLSLNAMAVNIGDANREVSTQVGLLSQVISALKGKVAGSGGGSDDPGYDPDMVTALIDRSVTDFTVPDGCTSIGNYAFYGCTNLGSVSLPDSITKIGTYAFVSCASLVLSSLPDAITSISSYAFKTCSELALTSLPDGITTISVQAFYKCTNISFTHFPESVSSIGNNAFQGCTGLTEITFKGKPTIISGSAFTDCTNLVVINVPWAEGAVPGAPWGATNATINYNHGI